MTVEELLRPRYKVIDDYPNMGDAIRIGDIIHGNACFKDNSYLSSYPHLFRKLEWHEERNPEDMPEYVKFKNDGNTGKVLDVIVSKTSGSIMIKTDCISQPDNRLIVNHCPVYWFNPATEQEYNEYIDQLNKNQQP